MGNVQVFSNLIVFQMAIFFFCLIAYLDGRMGKMLCSCWLLHHIGALSVVDLSTASWARGNFAVVLESAHNPNCLVCKLASQGRVCSRNASPCKQKKKRKGVALDLLLESKLPQHEKRLDENWTRIITIYQLLQLMWRKIILNLVIDCLGVFIYLKKDAV